MKLHYFDDDQADPNDFWLKASIQQGYVPATCLLSGKIVMSEINNGSDPCGGCAGPRHKCKGRDIDPVRYEQNSGGIL
jgi:hypothetical protein